MNVWKRNDGFLMGFYVPNMNVFETQIFMSVKFSSFRELPCVYSSTVPYKIYREAVTGEHPRITAVVIYHILKFFYTKKC